MMKRVAYSTFTVIFTILLLSQLTACSLAPDYQQPAIDLPNDFAGNAHWQSFAQLNNTPVTAWWQAFQDPQLNQLVEQVTLNNQNLAASEAQYQAALATLRASAASQYPTLGMNTGMSHGVLATNANLSNTAMPTITTYNLTVNASWEIDLWQRIHDNVSSNEAKAQASLADLQAARLSTQALFVQSYLQLYNLDQQQRLLNESIQAYQRFLNLTQARVKAGVASRLDITQAETQLYNAQAQQLDLQEQRQRLQHALATLLGKAPSQFQQPSLAQAHLILPKVPALIPSTLLANRPDIIASERRVYAANQQIGVAKSAYFPSLTLSASAAYRNQELANLIDLPNTLWSLGPTLALSLFDGGLREANTQLAIANMEQAAANYRQTVLTAFQEVEDNLSSLYWLQAEATQQQRSLQAAQQALEIAQKQYRAGVNSALNVISAQTAELSAKRTLADIQHRQRLAAVQLWKNMGSGTSLTETNQAPKVHELDTHQPS